VIVGSAIVRRIEQYRDDPQMSLHVGGFVRSLKEATLRQKVKTEVKA
jgi:tryptophan synthase alpha subunit